MAQATHLERTTAADRTMVQAAGTQRGLVQSAGTQYHLVQSTQTYVNYVQQMLAEATWYIDAAAPGYSGAQTVPNLGTGGTALDARLGSAVGADTNDPAWLDHTGTNHVWLPGVAGNYLSVPDAAALDITGDIDIRARVALTDWTPAAQNMLVSKYVSGTDGYFLAINDAGTLILGWGDGSGVLYGISTAATGVTDGAAKWVRGTLDADNGAAGWDVKFYLSDDGVTWTQLGATITTAGVTSIAADTVPVEIGSYFSGSASIATMKVYRAIVKDGIDGTTVLDVDTSVVTGGDATSFTATTGQTVTVNRSTSGRKAVAVVEKLWPLGTDDYIYSTATGTSQIVVQRTWSGSTPTFSLGYSTSPNGQVGFGGAAPTNGEVIASAMWGRTLTAAEQAALLTYFQTRG